MESRRMSIFALFACVFALYGCVGSVPEKAGTNLMTASIQENTFNNVSDRSALLLPTTVQGIQQARLQNMINGKGRYDTMMRDWQGNLSAKGALQSIAGQFSDQVNQKRKEIEEEKARIEEEKRQQEEEERQRAARTFNARITTYGVDCYGCYSYNGRGGTASGVALDVNMGVQQADGSFVPGITYGGYYVVAADPSVPMYSILKISNHGLSGSGISPNEPFYAIVLDRGGGIYGGHIDLYIGSENSAAVRKVSSGTPTVEIMQ